MRRGDARAVATSLEIPVRSGRLLAEGDLDFRGTLGVAKEAPVGFSAIRLSFELDADATPEQLATLLRLTECYCVVYQRSPIGDHVGIPASSSLMRVSVMRAATTTPETMVRAATTKTAARRSKASATIPPRRAPTT